MNSRHNKSLLKGIIDKDMKALKLVSQARLKHADLMASDSDDGPDYVAEKARNRLMEVLANSHLESSETNSLMVTESNDIKGFASAAYSAYDFIDTNKSKSIEICSILPSLS